MPMKKLLSMIALSGLTSFAFAQGEISWANTSSTLISYLGVPMPPNTNAANTIRFGLFIASYGTPAPDFWGMSDPNWQFVAAYTVNSTAASGVGRMQNPGIATVTGYAPGATGGHRSNAP